jgi:tRNA(Arg) A34 adenosine deaminase TadA
MLYAQVHLTLPAWIHDQIDLDRRYPGDEAKVALAIELSRLNVEHASGGPFGAVVFGPDDKVIAAGVNRVMPHATSLAHAENMAYMLAQQRLQTPRLNAVLSPVTLATSSQPCCQCYGATVWAGIDRLLIGANAADVEELTPFDEGPLPADWVGELNKRGIEVVRACTATPRAACCVPMGKAMAPVTETGIGLLCLCRQGFEPELAGELQFRAGEAGFAGYARTQRNDGYVLFMCDEAAALAPRLRWRELIFARQKLVVLAELPQLDPATASPRCWTCWPMRRASATCGWNTPIRTPASRCPGWREPSAMHCARRCARPASSPTSRTTACRACTWCSSTAPMPSSAWPTRPTARRGRWAFRA